jgi:hypothetical protein
MRHLGTPRWVIVAEVALATYLVALVLNYLWTADAHALSELSGLIRQVTLYFSVMLGVPTIALMFVLLVRRIARPVAVLAGVWLALNAFLWIHDQPAVAIWTACVALVVDSALFVEWRRHRSTSTRDRPPVDDPTISRDSAPRS